MKHPEKACDFLRTVEAKDYARPSDPSMIEATQNQIELARTFFKKSEKKVNEEGVEEEVVANPIGFLPDLRSDCKIYEWAGIGFGEFEVLNLQKSLQKQVAECAASEMKLWGKIRGSEKDYYIAEGKLEAAEGGDDAVEGFEPRGAAGVNKMVYWVTNSPMDKWT